MDRHRSEAVEYKVGDLVLLSTKDLKWQMIRRQSEKLTECYVGPYKIKKIVFPNVVKLELPNTIKIHSVVNVSRIRMYLNQVPGQKVEVPKPVIIEGEKKWEVERVLNKRKVQGKDKYLVQWKGFTAENNTWEGIENLENAKELVEEFEKEYGKEEREIRKQENYEERNEYWREIFPERFTARKLYGWDDKRYDREY